MQSLKCYWKKFILLSSRQGIAEQRSEKTKLDKIFIPTIPVGRKNPSPFNSIQIHITSHPQRSEVSHCLHRIFLDTFNLNQITDSYWSLQVFLALGLDWFPHLVLSQYLLKIHSFLILFFLLARFIHLNILMSFLDKLQYVPWKMTFIKSLLFPLLVYRGKNGREKRWLGTAFMFSTFVFLRGEETLKICPLSFLVRGGENTRGGKIKKRTEEFCVQAH